MMIITAPLQVPSTQLMTMMTPRFRPRFKNKLPCYFILITINKFSLHVFIKDSLFLVNSCTFSFDCIIIPIITPTTIKENATTNTTINTVLLLLPPPFLPHYHSQYKPYTSIFHHHRERYLYVCENE